MSTTTAATEKRRPCRPRKERTWELQQVDPTELVLDNDLQMRIDIPPIDEYVQLIQDNDNAYPFDKPVRAFKIKGKGEKLFVVNGFTRTRAAVKAGMKLVPVECSSGTMEDAIREACGSNSDHGYRRTNADKRRAVVVAMATFGKDLAVAKVAEICKVSHTYVHQLKHELTGSTPVAKAGRPKGAAEPAAEAPASTVESTNWEDVGGEAAAEDCGKCGVPNAVGAECEGCGTTTEAKPEQSPVDLAKSKTEQAKTKLGQLVRLLEELGYTKQSKDAVESISALLNKRRK